MGIMRISAMGLTMVAAGQLAQAQTQPATQPASSQPAMQSAPPTQPRTTTMEFRFENATIDSVLDEMSKRLGFVIEKTVALNGKVSVTAPGRVNADEAIMLLNTLLLTQGYAAIEKPERELVGGGKARVLRVLTWEQAKKEAPVGK